MTDTQLLNEAIDFIIEREKDDDYICSELHNTPKQAELCAKYCQGFGLDRVCVLRFLKYYKKGGEE